MLLSVKHCVMVCIIKHATIGITRLYIKPNQPIKVESDGYTRYQNSALLYSSLYSYIHSNVSLATSKASELLR